MTVCWLKAPPPLPSNAQIISGGGSKVGEGFLGDRFSPFQHAGAGFVAVRLGPDSMALDYMGPASHQPMFSISIPRGH